MQSARFRCPDDRNQLTTALAMTLVLSIGLIGCGGDDGAADTSSDSLQQDQQENQQQDQQQELDDNGFNLRSGDMTIEATTSASLLPAYGQGTFNMNLVGGWVDFAAASAARREADEQAEMEQARRSFGT